MVEKQIFKYILVFSCAFTFMFSNVKVYAIDSLPLPNKLVFVSEKMEIPLLRGLRINPDNPFEFDFIIDSPQQQYLDKSEIDRLLAYFLTVLTVEEDNFWVNLSPQEENRIIDNSLVKTELGKDLLAQDYLLKQLTSSITDPETETGIKYWESVGTTLMMSANDFNKIWIESDRAEVFEHENTVIITDSSLKVTSQSKAHNVFIDQITKDVNEGKNFTRLRQIYSAFILASWFKETFTDTLYEAYIDKHKMHGIDNINPKHKKEVFNTYLKSYKDGVYSKNLKQELASGRKVKRNYSVGGVFMRGKPNKAETFVSLSSSVSLVRSRFNFIKEETSSSMNKLEQFQNNYFNNLMNKLFEYPDLKLAKDFTEEKRIIDKHIIAFSQTLDEIADLYRNVVALDVEDFVAKNKFLGQVISISYIAHIASDINHTTEFTKSLLNSEQNKSINYNYDYGQVKREAAAIEALINLLNDDDMNVRSATFEKFLYTILDYSQNDRVKANLLIYNIIENNFWVQRDYVAFIFDELLKATDGTFKSNGSETYDIEIEKLIVEFVNILLANFKASARIFNEEFAQREKQLKLKLSNELYSDFKSILGGKHKSLLAVSSTLVKVAEKTINSEFLEFVTPMQNIYTDDKELFMFWRDLLANISGENTVSIKLIHDGKEVDIDDLARFEYDDERLIEAGEKFEVYIGAKTAELKRLGAFIARDLFRYPGSLRSFNALNNSRFFDTRFAYKKLVEIKNNSSSIEGGIRFNKKNLKSKAVNISNSFNKVNQGDVAGLRITTLQQELIHPEQSYLLFN